jgi:hypothetical protein
VRRVRFAPLFALLGLVALGAGSAACNADAPPPDARQPNPYLRRPGLAPEGDMPPAAPPPSPEPNRVGDFSRSKGKP